MQGVQVLQPECTRQLVWSEALPQSMDLEVLEKLEDAARKPVLSCATICSF